MKFSDISIMSRSKHCSHAVHVYQKEDFGLSDDICRALEPPLDQKSLVTSNADQKLLYQDMGNTENAPVSTEGRRPFRDQTNKLNNTLA